MAKGSGVPPFPVNEDQVSEVDDEPGGLADDENGVFAEDRIDQQKRPPHDAEDPERKRHDTPPRPFAGNPLDQKAGGKHPLSQKAKGEQTLFQQLRVIPG